MTNIDDLHNEARVLPIKEHTYILAKQYAITCYNPRHPCHSLTTRPLPHRPQMKPDLFYRYENQLPNQRIEKKKPKDYKKSCTHRPSTKSAAVSDRTLFTEAHLLKYTKQNVHYQGSAEHAWHNSETDTVVF